MAELELKLFYFINKSCANPVFDILTPLLTLLGEYNFSIALALFLILVLRKERKMVGIVYLTGLLASGFVLFLLKHAFPKNTPFTTLEGVRQVVEELEIMQSFPSGHATCAFLTAAVFSCYFRYGYLLFFFAIAAAFTRVYSGIHYPSDAIIGAAIGTVTGYVMVYAARKTEKFHHWLLGSRFFTQS